MSLENDSNIFQRCPHDKEHPYTMVSRALIRDQTISPECRWLIIYLLSNKEGWKIQMRQVINHCKGFIGRDKIYGFLNEAIAAGYILREEYKDSKNMSRIRYLVSEERKFLKLYPLPEGQDAELQDTEDQDAKERAVLKKEQNNNNSLVDTVVPTKKVPPSIDAYDIANLLWMKIQAINPKQKPPKIEEWAKEIDRMHRLDKREYEEIRRVINFAFEDSFWVTVLQSADGLRRNFDKISVKMIPVDNSGSRMVKNRAIAQEMKSAIKANEKKWKNFFITTTHVIRIDSNEQVSLELEPKLFELTLMRLFNITKD